MLAGVSTRRYRIAAAVLPLDVTELRRPRADDGIRAALRVLVTAREQMTGERTRHTNALTALVRVVVLGVDARRPLSGKQVAEIAHWRAREGPVSTLTARAEAVRLAKRIGKLDTELRSNQAALGDLEEPVKSPRPCQTEKGEVTPCRCSDRPTSRSSKPGETLTS